MCWLNKTKRLLANFPKTSALALGCLSVAALPPYYLLPLLAAAFGGLMFLLLASPSPKKAFAVGYWFGFGHFACGLFWINNALMMDLPRLGWLIPLCFAGSGGFFGLFAAFPALFCRFFKGNWPRLLAFAAAWTFFEWIRSFIFTGFPWNLLGYRLGIQRQRHSGRRAVRNLRAFAFHRHRRRCLGHSVILPRKEKPCFRRSLFRTDPDTAVCIRQPSSRPIPRRELLRRQHPNCPAGHSPANEVETGNAGTKFADLYSNVRSRPCPANRHDHLGRNGQPLCPQFAAAVS